MIHLIHGIHTEPTSPVKGLVPYLVAAGWKVRYPEYGYELALETKVINQMISGTIAAYVEPGDILIGHSNGCDLIARVISRIDTRGFATVHLFAAAADGLANRREILDLYFHASNSEKLM
jgi:hypothetical protein